MYMYDVSVGMLITISLVSPNLPFFLLSPSAGTGGDVGRQGRCGYSGVTGEDLGRRGTWVDMDRQGETWEDRWRHGIHIHVHGLLRDTVLSDSLMYMYMYMNTHVHEYTCRCGCG